MVLPLLGGSASVWTTCVLFFQMMLLGGYIYAHALARLADIRKQLLIHVVLTFGAWFHPFFFFRECRTRLCRTSDLMAAAAIDHDRRRFRSSPFRQLRDPYFLYAASNAGSLLSLAIYPLLVEPRFGLVAQSRAWSMGYAGLLALLALTTVLIAKHADPVKPIRESSPTAWKDRAFWTVCCYWFPMPRRLDPD